MAQLCDHQEELEQLNADVLVISFSEAYWAQGWLEETGSPFPLLLDPDRQVYQAYGLERSRLRSWGPRTLWYYLRKKLAGHELPAIQGDPHQLGGDFIVDADGLIRLAYLSHDPTDRPPVADLLAVLADVDGRTDQPTGDPPLGQNRNGAQRSPDGG